jgi:putative effector of murein hydrolase LrgA (UPF0299 family)
MQPNFAIVSVFILFAALQGGVIYCADGDTTAMEILCLVFTFVCPILVTVRHSLHNDDSTGNSITTSPFAVLQLISTHHNEIKTGLHQQ